MKEQFSKIIDTFRINSEKKPQLGFFVPTMVLFGFVIYAFEYFIGHGLFWLTHHTYTYNKLPESFSFLDHPIKMVLISVLMYPILETLGEQMLPIELLRIRRTRIWLMILISSIIWILVHIIGRHSFNIGLALGAIIYFLPMGLILPYSYLRFRKYSIFLAIGVTALIHGLYNTTIFLIWGLFIWFIASGVSPVGAQKALEITNLQHNEKVFLFCIDRGYSNAVKAYLSEGINPNIEDQNITALMYAAFEGKISIINALLDYGADINAKGKDGQTALLIAAGNGQNDAVKTLLDKGADIKAKDAYGLTALIEAAAFGHTSTVQVFLEKGVYINEKNNNGSTALSLAAALGHTTTVQFLLDHGAEINVKNKYGWTALMLASLRGHTATVQVLLDRGAAVNAMNKNSETALVFAVGKGYADVVKLLIEKGADVNIKSPQGETLLKFAESKKHPEIVKLLKQAGAKE